MQPICVYPDKKQTVCDFLSKVRQVNTVIPTDNVLLFRDSPCMLVKIPVPVFLSYSSPPIPVPLPADTVNSVGVEYTGFLPPLLRAADNIYLGNGGDPVSSAPNQISEVFSWNVGTTYNFTFSWDPVVQAIRTTINSIPILTTKYLEDSLWMDLGTPYVGLQDTSTSLVYPTILPTATQNFINVAFDQSSDPSGSIQITDLVYTNAGGFSSSIETLIDPTPGNSFIQDYSLAVQPSEGFTVSGKLLFSGAFLHSATQALTSAKFQLLIKQKF